MRFYCLMSFLRNWPAISFVVPGFETCDESGSDEHRHTRAKYCYKSIKGPYNQTRLQSITTFFI